MGEEDGYLIDLAVRPNRDRIRSDRELRQTIANMSHDLRTPLTSIIGYTKLLEARSVTEEKRQEYVSRTICGYELRLEPVHMNALLWEVLTGFYDQFNE